MKVSSDMTFMNTPHNVGLPAIKALDVLYPGIDIKNSNDPCILSAPWPNADLAQDRLHQAPLADAALQ
jgi:hypothetical protein